MNDIISTIQELLDEHAKGMISTLQLLMQLIPLLNDEQNMADILAAYNKESAEVTERLAKDLNL